MIEVDLRIFRPRTVVVKIDGLSEPADFDSKATTDIGFTVRTMTCLMNANLMTVGAVRKKTLNEMMAYRNFGKKCIREIYDKLHDMGVVLDWRFQ